MAFSLSRRTRLWRSQSGRGRAYSPGFPFLFVGPLGGRPSSRLALQQFLVSASPLENGNTGLAWSQTLGIRPQERRQSFPPSGAYF